METPIVVAIVTAAGATLVAAATFLLNSHQERKSSLQQRKVGMYTELLTAISDLAVLGLNEETQGRFARAVNTIGLTAPQEVIEAVLDFTAEIQVSKLDRTKDRHDQLLNTLILRIRKSLELPFADDPKTFRFRLLGGFPQESTEDEARSM